MKPLLSYTEFVNESLNVTPEESLLEAVGSLRGIKGSKSELKKALKDKLAKQAPSLAGDDDFLDQLADSYEPGE